MVFPLSILLLFLVCFLVTFPGFKNYLWFIAQGYGLSICCQGLMMLLFFHSRLTTGTALCCLALVLYGLRLFGFLQYRTRRVKSYAKSMKGETRSNSLIAPKVKTALWISVVILYVFMVSPVFYRLYNNEGSDIFTYLGFLIMIAGIVIETLSDFQKNAAKKTAPNKPVTTGLYAIVRCPNYLGELILWTGVLISGLHGVVGLQWLVAFLGYLGIVFVMFSGARRLEIRQNKRYGDDPEYQKYVKTVPILIPGVPLYSVEKYTWLKA